MDSKELTDSESDIKEEIRLILERCIEGEIEPIVKGDIKEEKELLIESDWIPEKFEDENEYQEFMEEGNHNMFSEAIVTNDGYRHIAESPGESDGDYENDDNAESDEHDSGEKDDYLVEVASPEAVDGEDSSESIPLYQLQLNKWILENFIECVCPVCTEKLSNYTEWEKHVILYHKESIEESECNYYLSSDDSGVCKICNQKFTTQYSRYVHTKKHIELTSKSHIHVCKICNFKSKRTYVQNHILKKHPEVVEEFKPSNSIKNMKCPLCSYTYTKRLHLGYHFKDKHSKEHKAKAKYNCPLCKQGCFGEKEPLLQHLVEVHFLNSWKILNFRKVFEDNDFFACTKCNKLFFQNDTYKLLSHFLHHETKFAWQCKFCYNKFGFQTSPVIHLCGRTILHYEKCNENAKVSRKKESKIKTLQEFEEYFAHVCPFCNKEFNKMLKWQHHLRSDHKIDTLKGLQMDVVDNENNKLRCLVCCTVISNFPEQIHAHSFQHLPYKPYKCLSCLKMLDTFKTAIDHVLQSCIDDDSSYDNRSSIKIQCSICNFQKMQDLKSVLKHYENEHNYFKDFFIEESDKSTMTCRVCHKKYACKGKKSFFLHLHHHFDEKTFKCKLCLRSFITFRAISEHLLKCHNAKLLNKQSLETQKIYPQKERQDGLCLICHKILENKLFLDKHMDTYHARRNRYTHEVCETKIFELIDANTLVDRYKTTDENKKKASDDVALGSNDTTDINAVAESETAHKNSIKEFISYVCPECNAGMTTKEHWYNHIRTQHNFFDESNLYIKAADGSLKCPTCSIDLKSDRSKRHKLTHMLYKSFVCNLCHERCIALKTLYAHIRRMHFAQGTFECPICPEILQTEYKKTQHIKEIHPPNIWPDKMCLICFKMFSTTDTLRNHQVVVHINTTFRYSCDICGFKVLTVREFNAHMNSHKIYEIKEKLGDGIVSQSLSKTSQSNNTNNDIAVVNKSENEHTNNSKKESGELIISCEIQNANIDGISPPCSSANGQSNDTTNRIDILNESDTEHDFEEFLSCEIKKETFVNDQSNDSNPIYILSETKFLSCEIKEEMVYDIIVERGSENSHSDNTTATEHKYKKRMSSTEYGKFISYACPECNEVMTTQELWYSHIGKQHKFFDKSNLYIKEEDGSLKCPTCKATLNATPFSLRRHKLIHMRYKPFICKLCYMRSNSLSVIYSHFRTQHFVQGRFECPICYKVLQSNHQKWKHIKTIHARNEWPDKMCSVCYKMCRTKKNLKMHMVVHTTDRVKYTCDVCGSSISYPQNFKIHMEKHKNRGDINENIGYATPSQLGLQNSQAKQTGIDIVPESGDINKIKSITISSGSKRKKIDA